MQWKLGVSVESSNGSATNAPFVSVLVRIMDSNGRPCSRAFELTIKEFQALARNFKDISNLMDSL